MRLAGMDTDCMAVDDFIRSMDRRKPPKPPGLFGTSGTRPKVKTTSSAVKGLPSCQVTPWRSLNSHSVSLIAR